MFRIWIKDLDELSWFDDNYYELYKVLAGEDFPINERRPQAMPSKYEERRRATMLEF